MVPKLLAVVAATAHMAACGAVSSFQLSEDESAVSIGLTSGTAVRAPFTNAEQEAFGYVKVSPDGKYIGWVAMLPNCCTSYPLPLSLVIHDGSRVIRIVGPVAPPIFDWSFSADGRSVVYMQQFPHGNSPRIFHWLRVRDGKSLGEFECFPDEPDLNQAAVAPPKWVKPLAKQCIAQSGS